MQYCQNFYIPAIIIILHKHVILTGYFLIINNKIDETFYLNIKTLFLTQTGKK